MSGVKKPYFLTVRQFADEEYSEGGRWQYIRHPSYSNKPSNYIRSYLLLQKDLIDLFNYIEPSDTNLTTYSYRIQELLLRTCVEIEANFKAILAANKYSKSGRLDITDFAKVNASHFLSDYLVKLPFWSENLITAIRQPFKDWGSPPDTSKPWRLTWYDAYNKSKHDKANSLHHASLENLIDAFCGLVALVTAQYMFEDFGPQPDLLAINSGYNDGFDSAVGDYFRVALPRMIPEDERYGFDWQAISSTSSPFVKFDYDAV